jgi:hypothetical protein
MNSTELAERYVDIVLVNASFDVDLFTPDAVAWHNYDDVVRPIRHSGDRMKVIKAVFPDFGNTDIRRGSWPGGFVLQYTIQGTSISGAHVGVPTCTVATVRDGKIARIDRYCDTAQMRAITDEVASHTPT